MDNFDYQRSTELYFGRSTENDVGQLVKYRGGRRVLVLYGTRFAISSGLMDRVRRSLDRSGLEYFEQGGIIPNARADKIYAAIELGRAHDCDYVLAVGGGSVIDSAKAVAAGFYYRGDFWDLISGKEKIVRSLPLGSIVTMPAAGSECSSFCIITGGDALRPRKCLVTSPCLIPQFAVLNPELTLSLPPYESACGCVEMMSNILMRYFTNTKGVFLTDRICEAIMNTVVQMLPRVLEDRSDYDARANIMLSATLAHNGFCSIGRRVDFAPYQLSFGLCDRYDCQLGAALAVIVPAWLEFTLLHQPLRGAQLAHMLFGTPINFEHPEVTAEQGIHRLRTFWKRSGMPANFHELGARREDIAALIADLNLGEGGTIGSFVKLDEIACEAVYTIASSRF